MGAGMRTKIVILIISTVLIAGFAMLNVDELTRVSTVNFGFTSMQMPLGLLMLMLVVTVLMIFLATSLYMQGRHLLETRQYAKQLTAQRDLADKAEASRFTDLRHYMESQAILAMNRSSDAIAATDHRLTQTEILLLKRLEQLDNSNAAYWGQHDDALRRKVNAAST
jgi:uncharacterized integral membrane protein